MKKSVIFWASLLIVLGTLLLLGTLGVIPFGWGLIWPLLLIAAGAWLVWAALTRPAAFEVQDASIPLDDSVRAHVSIHHGAGRLIISSGAPAGRLVEGRFRGGLDYRADRTGDLLEVHMRVPDQGSRWANPWSWNDDGLDWILGLTADIALDLELETGAGALEADLSGLRIGEFRLKTGASSSELVLPANAGYTRVELEGGAASVSIRVPPGVAAHIVSRGSASSTTVDLNRFPQTRDGYRSADYDAAPNKVDIFANLGAASLKVR